MSAVAVAQVAVARTELVAQAVMVLRRLLLRVVAAVVMAVARRAETQVAQHPVMAVTITSELAVV
jgi:hypothetical protein